MTEEGALAGPAVPHPFPPSHPFPRRPLWRARPWERKCAWRAFLSRASSRNTLGCQSIAHHRMGRGTGGILSLPVSGIPRIQTHHLLEDERTEYGAV